MNVEQLIAALQELVARGVPSGAPVMMPNCDGSFQMVETVRDASFVGNELIAYVARRGESDPWQGVRLSLER